MIKANELRIGNWVSNGKIERPYQCDGNMIYDSWISENGIFDPIPITPEILIKDRLFIRDGNDLFWKKSKGDTHYLELNFCNGLFYPCYTEIPEFSHLPEQRVYMNYIEHIHQLQNLYFALTGEELAVNL